MKLAKVLASITAVPIFDQLRIDKQYAVIFDAECSTEQIVPYDDFIGSTIICSCDQD